MDLLDKIAEDSKKGIDGEYVSLKVTTPLSKDLIKAHPKWEYVKKYYNLIDNQENADRMFHIFVSFVNSVLTQERIYFTMGLKSFKDVFNNDTNWEKFKPNGFRDEAWAKFRKYIKEKNIVKALNEGKNGSSKDRTSLLYELTDPSLLAYIVVDREAQKEESYNFIYGNTTDETTEGSSGRVFGRQDKISNKVSKEQEEEIASQPTNQQTNDNKTKDKLDIETFFRTNLDVVPKEINAGKEEMYMLAEKAINNAEFDPDSATDRRKLVKYFKQKLGHKKDGYANVLVDAFSDGIMDLLALKKAEGFEYKEPPPINMDQVKMELDMERRNQQKVNAMLKLQFGEQTLRQLKEDLKTETDECERMRIEHEIKIWGG